MKRARAALFGSMLIALAALGISAPTAVAVAPAGYSPGSPAGSEYREQLSTARELGAPDRGRQAPSERHAAVSFLFGAGVTPGDDARGGGASTGSRDAAAPGRDGSGGKAAMPAAEVSERSAIAAAARAPIDGPPASLVTGALVAAALLATGLLVLLIRRQDVPR